MCISDWSSDVCSSDLDPEQPRAAMRAAIDAARGAGRKVAFTLSDNFVIDRHRADFIDLIDQGLTDITFSNECETQSLAGANDFAAAVSHAPARAGGGTPPPATTTTAR